MEKAYKYLGYFLLLMIPLIFIAFQPNYISKFPNFDANYDVFIHIHAFLASLWVVTLIVQPFFIVNKKMHWHRVVGKLSYLIFPLFILSFVPGIIKLFRSGEYKYIFFPAGDCVVLIMLYTLAVYYKKKSAKHMRFMIASSLTLLGPTLGRIGPMRFGWSEVEAQTFQYAITFGILLSLILYDRKNKRNFSPYLVAVYAFVIHAAVFYVLFL